ncbi:MAG: hypothetical protein ACXWJ6_16760 [Xanthobacteraceae bacterium]
MRIAIAIAALALTAETAQAQRTVVNGQTVQLSFIYSINPDCTPRGIPTIHVTQQPQHGRVHVARISNLPNFREPNVRTVCNRRRVSGSAISYTAQRGYVGPDSISAEAIYPSGLYRRGTFNIYVR